jgi:hypothetical protein
VQLTKDLLEKIVNSDEFKILASNILLKMAEAETTRKEVNSYAIPLFITMNIVEGPDSKYEPGSQIVNPKYIYLADDNCPQFDRYLQLIHPLHLEHGYNVEPDCCPILIAENNQTKAEDRLFRFMEALIGTMEWTELQDRENLLKECL